MARKRVLRVIEYVGEEEWISATISKSLIGELACGAGTVRVFDCVMHDTMHVENELDWFSKILGGEEQIAQVLHELDGRAATGLDMSPGDDLARKAATVIRRLFSKR